MSDMPDMFDIKNLMKSLSSSYSSKTVNEAVLELVKKGILEQYTDENGDFCFQLTKLGLECGEELIKDPNLFDPDKEDENDGNA